MLYEMLVGEPPHTGSTAQAILGKIIQAAPVSATAVRASVPGNVDAAVRKALEKLSADRFTSARDFARALAEPGFRHGADAAAPGAGGKVGWSRTTSAFAAMFGVTALALGWTALRRVPAAAPVAPVVNFTVPVGEGADVYLGGQRDAIGVGRGARPWPCRRTDGFWPTRLGPSERMGTQSHGSTCGVSIARKHPPGRVPKAAPAPSSRRMERGSASWTPTVASEGFSIADGDVETIAQDARADARGLRGATWGEGHTIVYGGAEGLYRLPEDGGDPELLAKNDTVAPGLFLLAQPQWLPGGRTLLFQGDRSPSPNDAEVLALDVATGTRTTLLTNAMDPRYVETGQLLFMRRGTLMAVAFDPETLEVRGAPVAVIEDVMQALAMPNDNWSTGAISWRYPVRGIWHT